MKIGFIADVHLANHRRFAKPSRGSVAPVNTRAADTLSVISAARRKAEKEGCSDLFVLGDVFDTTAPEPQLIAELSRALATTGDLEVHVLVGNHDQASDAPGDHALIALDGHRNVNVYDKPQLIYPGGGEAIVHAVPYMPGKAVEYLPGVLGGLRSEISSAERRGRPEILGLHLGLRHEKIDPWLQNTHDSFPAKDLAVLGYDLVVAGNWHGRHEVLPSVWQCGALVPTGFDNPGWTGDYGTLLVYDGKKAWPHELPGPRFVKAVGLQELRVQLESAADHEWDYPVYVSARVDPEERAAAEELLEVFGFPADRCEMLTAKQAVEEAARAAAKAARYASVEGVTEAIKAYVARMQLPEGISREHVSAMAVDYLAGAAQD